MKGTEEMEEKSWKGKNGTNNSTQPGTKQLETETEDGGKEGTATHNRALEEPKQ